MRRPGRGAGVAVVVRAGAALAAALALALAAGNGTARAAAPKPAPGGDFKAIYDGATTLYKAGSYAEALGAYQKAYGIDPRAEVLYNIARCYDQLHKPMEAVDAYEKFLAAAPSHEGAGKARGNLVSALHALGAVRLGLGDFAGARAAYERALDVLPAAPPGTADVGRGALLAELADALDGAGDRPGATARAREALASLDLPADARARTEALLARLEAAAAAESAAATRPAGPGSAVAVPAGSGAAGGGGGAHRRPKWLWPAVAGGAGAVALVVLLGGIAAAATPPHTDLGYMRARFEP
ncbi:MAG TPA: tetratricopeptide repeat protein [Myxococcota bacterium]|nr:tetratricopeptide repeat protein [Myxococcota bacterium]